MYGQALNINSMVVLISNLAYTGIFNPNNDNHSYSDGNITTAGQSDKKEATNAQSRFRLSSLASV